MDPLYPPVNDVLEFLQELYERGLGYSCLNTARSALSSFIVLDGNVTVTEWESPNVTITEWE